MTQAQLKYKGCQARRFALVDNIAHPIFLRVAVPRLCHSRRFCPGRVNTFVVRLILHNYDIMALAMLSYHGGRAPPLQISQPLAIGPGAPSAVLKARQRVETGLCRTLTHLR